MASRSKIARELGDAELEEFLSELRHEPNLTLRRLQEICAAKGILISHQGAANFLNAEYKPYLERLERAKHLANSLSAMQDGENTAGTIADSAASHLSRLTFDFMMTLEDLDDSDPAARAELMESLARIIRSLRQGDVQREALNLRIRTLEEEKQKAEAAMKQAREKLTKARETGGLTAEAIELIESAAKFM